MQKPAGMARVQIPHFPPYAVIAQQVEHVLGKDGVASSNLASSSIMGSFWFRQLWGVLESRVCGAPYAANTRTDEDFDYCELQAA